MQHVDIYTDGACRGNPGKGAWASILVYQGREKQISGYFQSTTNNRMELTAVIEAFKCLKRKCEVTVHSDSKYVVDAVNAGWLLDWMSHNWKNSSGKLVKNVDLWKSFWELYKQHHVTFQWVKGHAGNDYNERCDQLANTVIDSFE